MLYFLDVSGDAWPATSGVLGYYSGSIGRYEVVCGKGVLFETRSEKVAKAVRDALVKVAGSHERGVVSFQLTEKEVKVLVNGSVAHCASVPE